MEHLPSKSRADVPYLTQLFTSPFLILQNHYTLLMILTFTGKIFYWRGPSPFYFVTVPDEQSQAIKSVSKIVTYGWGVIPVNVQIGKTKFYTALFPKDGLYLVPIKASVRKKENIDLEDEVALQLEIRL